MNSSGLAVAIRRRSAPWSCLDDAGVVHCLRPSSRHGPLWARGGGGPVPTALVHEAYKNLARRTQLQPEDRSHFLNIAARTMRRILIDHARARKRVKRGAGDAPVLLEEIHALMTDSAADELVALDDALDRLAVLNERAALVVERRFFASPSKRPSRC